MSTWWPSVVLTTISYFTFVMLIPRITYIDTTIEKKQQYLKLFMHVFSLIRAPLAFFGFWWLTTLLLSGYLPAIWHIAPICSTLWQWLNDHALLSPDGNVYLYLPYIFAAVCGLPLIAWLKARLYQQTAYEDAPATHRKKSGTPTMGGLLFLIALLADAICIHDDAARALIGLGLASGFIGAVDDISAIRRGRNRGLQARTKFLATIAVAVVFLTIAVRLHLMPLNTWYLPALTVPSWVILGIGFAAILATTHAVNLTDGLDGLAGGSIIPALLWCVWFALHHGAIGIALVDATVVAAVVGFLMLNFHPARLFMGDTGSLALGALLAGSMILVGATPLLPLLGAVFAAEALSVILQVSIFKRTGRRIFRMSPLHHHFELGGTSEQRITWCFWGTSVLCALGSWALAR